MTSAASKKPNRAPLYGGKPTVSGELFAQVDRMGASARRLGSYLM
jgi:hypothetical protein